MEVTETGPPQTPHEADYEHGGEHELHVGLAFPFSNPITPAENTKTFL